MENSKISINISFPQIIELVKQLTSAERQKLRKEILRQRNFHVLTIKEIKDVVKEFETEFGQKIGKYTTMQDTADTWAEVIRFGTKESPNTFGIKFGCFRNELDGDFTHLGMKLYVLEEGPHTQYKKHLLSFFKQNLKTWVQVGNQRYNKYKNSYSNLCVDFSDHETGLKGKAFLKYRSIEKFYDEFEVRDFFEECITGLVSVFSIIKENPKGLFTDVYRSEPPFEKII